jgi:hypothetical protein
MSYKSVTNPFFNRRLEFEDIRAVSTEFLINKGEWNDYFCNEFASKLCFEVSRIVELITERLTESPSLTIKFRQENIDLFKAIWEYHSHGRYTVTIDNPPDGIIVSFSKDYITTKLKSLTRVHFDHIVERIDSIEEAEKEKNEAVAYHLKQYVVFPTNVSRYDARYVFLSDVSLRPSYKKLEDRFLEFCNVFLYPRTGWLLISSGNSGMYRFRTNVEKDPNYKKKLATIKRYYSLCMYFHYSQFYATCPGLPNALKRQVAEMLF